jgi:pilus assembly protein CpaC
MPYGHGQSYAQDVGYNVFNPAPALGGMAPQSGYASQGYHGMAPGPTGNAGYPGGNHSPMYAPAGVSPQPTMAPPPAPQPQAQPQPGPGPQGYRPSNRGPIQQASGVRGVPRSTGIRPNNYR